MVDFNNLDALYEHIEETVLTDENFHQTIDLFKKFRERKHEENNQTEAEKAQWEIDFLSFFFDRRRSSTSMATN